jgi:LmbE family N-acetylglucosaminyl deacetylase
VSAHMVPMPQDWQRLLAVVAHPDDLEYGAASAVAAWTRAGKHVGYVIVTDGEAGIDALRPEVAGPVRRGEQEASAALVGVEDVTFLAHPDGAVAYGPELRRDIARQIRRFRPDILLTATYDLTFGAASVNQADHRQVGVAVLDAARDAGNRWIFPELVEEGYEPWAGVTHVYVMGAAEPTHGVDVTETLSAGIDSLRAHATYLDGLGRDFDATEFLTRMTAAGGETLGCASAVTFGRLQLAGV